MIVSNHSLKTKGKEWHNKAVSFIKVEYPSGQDSQRPNHEVKGTSNDRVKRISASGGCLGDDRRRRTCKPAKSVGELAKEL